MFNPGWLALSSQLLPAEPRQSQGVFPGRAAVLLALSGDPADPHIVLTRRAAHLAHHPAEIAFPGGKWERDDETLVQTALRESFEEIGLPPDRVTVLGRYPDRQTLRGVLVTPVVGVIPENLPLVPDPAELDCIFTMPLRLLRSSQAVAWRSYRHQGRDYRVPQFEYRDYTI